MKPAVPRTSTWTSTVRGATCSFGAKFSVLRTGELSVGDELRVTARGESALETTS